MNNSGNKLFWVSLIVIAILGISARLFLQGLGEGHDSYDISSHVEMTGRAFENRPVSEHSLLPSVSLERENFNDAHTLHRQWGATRQNEGGSALIYTSFSSAAFVLPYFVQEIFNFDNYQYSIITVSMLCYLSSLILLALILRRAYMLYHKAEVPIWLHASAALFITFCPEAITSLGGLNFWAQSIALPLHLAVILTLCYVDWHSKPQKRHILLVLVLSTCAAYVEWSMFCGLFFLAGLLLLSAVKPKYICIAPRSVCLIWSSVLITSAVLAALLIVIHFSMQLNLCDLFLTSCGRAGARAGLSLQLLLMYFLLLLDSFAFFLIAFIVLILTNTSQIRFLGKMPTTLKIVVLLVFGLLLENLLLLNHAAQYSYDNLKWIALTPMIFILVPPTRTVQYYKRILLTFAGAALLSLGMEGYIRYDWSKKLNNLFLNNEKIVNQALAEAGLAQKDLVIALQDVNRGCTTLMFDVNIYEHFNPELLRTAMQQENKKRGILFSLHSAYRDIPCFAGYKIYDLDKGTFKEYKTGR